MDHKRVNQNSSSFAAKALLAIVGVTIVACAGTGGGTQGTEGDFEPFVYRTAGTGGRQLRQIELPEATRDHQIPTSLSETIHLGPIANRSEAWVVRYTAEAGYSIAILRYSGGNWTFESEKQIPGLDPILNFSVAGSTFAFERSVGGTSRILLLDRFGTTMRPLPAPAGMAQREPVLSDDQNRVYWTTGTTIKCTDNLRSTPSDPLDLRGAPVAGWSPDFDPTYRTLWFIGPDPANASRTMLFKFESSVVPMVEVPPRARNLRVGNGSVVYSYTDDEFGSNPKLRVHSRSSLTRFLLFGAGTDYRFAGDFVALSNPTP
ncbi:MAG: hypothetical protein SFX74_13090 [Fimbriimonadaceae bacterium]|nr:hypothetical protein [Fimbriimonadaceae bacterium]